MGHHELLKILAWWLCKKRLCVDEAEARQRLMLRFGRAKPPSVNAGIAVMEFAPMLYALPSSNEETDSEQKTARCLSVHTMCEMLARKVVTRVDAGQFVVLVDDVPSLVPVQKEPLQKKRAKARASQQARIANKPAEYDRDCVVTENGLRRNNHTVAYEPIYVPHLLGCSSVRRQFLAVFVRYLRQRSWTAGTLIVDADTGEDSLYRRPHLVCTRADLKPVCDVLCEEKRRYGEGEMAAVHWLKRLAAHPELHNQVAVLVTKDNDAFLLLLTQYLSMRYLRVYWCSSPDCYFSVRDVFNALSNKEDKRPALDLLVLMYVFNGCDYVFKSDICAGKGWKKIVPVCDAVFKEHDEPEEIETLIHAVRDKLVSQTKRKTPMRPLGKNTEELVRWTRCYYIHMED